MDLFVLLLLINMIRNEPLVLDNDLSQRAEIRAEYLCENNQWSHDKWRDSFKGLTEPQGENLARGFDSEVDMFIALYQSDTHRENMKHQKFTKIGIAEDCNKTVFLFN